MGKKVNIKGISVLILSTLFCFLILEISLQACLFNEKCKISSIKDPKYYSKTDEDLWYFHYIFTEKPIQNKTYAKTTPFIDTWGLSLQPDALLGYSRKPNITIACHETTNLGTRGLKQYSYKNKNIVFYGDSFTESKACSNNTITAKIEQNTGIDTLNYGVGGYGFDQIYLLFNRTHHNFDPDKTIFLIGLIENDLYRMTLVAFVTPKPYFDVINNTLILHTEHITPNDLYSYFKNYKPNINFYLPRLIMSKLGLPLKYKEKRLHLYEPIITLVMKEIKKIKDEKDLNLYFVLLYPGNRVLEEQQIFEFFRTQLDENEFKYIDLRDCYHTVDKEHFDEYFVWHATPKGNEVLAKCISKRINASAQTFKPKV